MAESNADPPAGVQRESVAARARRRCERLRADCRQARFAGVETVPAEIRAEFQRSVCDYFWALRPFRSAEAVAACWDDTPSERWLRDYSVEDGVATAEYHPSLEAVAAIDADDRPLPFDVLADLADALDDAADAAGVGAGSG